MAKLIYPKLSYKIMGILFKVHQELGPHLLEKYYQRAIEQELKNQGLKFSREVPVKISYGNKSIGRYLLDFVIENKVILEIKAQSEYSSRFFRQALAYLRQTNLPLAIIANFRKPSLEYKRVINPEFKDANLSEN